MSGREKEEVASVKYIRLLCHGGRGKWPNIQRLKLVFARGLWSGISRYNNGLSYRTSVYILYSFILMATITLANERSSDSVREVNPYAAVG